MGPTVDPPDLDGASPKEARLVSTSGAQRKTQTAKWWLKCFPKTRKAKLSKSRGSLSNPKFSRSFTGEPRGNRMSEAGHGSPGSTSLLAKEGHHIPAGSCPSQPMGWAVPTGHHDSPLMCGKILSLFLFFYCSFRNIYVCLIHNTATSHTL